MRNLRQSVNRIQWRWALPTAMTLLSVTLWLVGTYELHKHPGAIDVVPLPYLALDVIDYPAFTVARLLPSFAIRVWDIRVGLETLLAVFLQWTLIGFVVDRGLERKSVLTSGSV